MECIFPIELNVFLWLAPDSYHSKELQPDSQNTCILYLNTVELKSNSQCWACSILQDDDLEGFDEEEEQERKF